MTASRQTLTRRKIKRQTHNQKHTRKNVNQLEPNYCAYKSAFFGRKAPANQYKWINFCFSHWEKHNKLFYSTYLIADLKFIVCSCLTLTIFTKISLLERTSLWRIFEIKTKALLSSQHFVIYSTQESNIILVCCSYCLWYFSQ